MRQAQIDAGDRKDGLTSDEREEVARLRNQVKQPEMEREILQKQRPGSLGKVWNRSDLWIHEGVPGQVSGLHDEPHIESFGERLLCMDEANAIGACAVRHPARRPD